MSSHQSSAITKGEPIFLLKEVTKQYQMGSEVVSALNGLNLRIDAGDYLSILGPSGSGKSTLMHILGFMDEATHGEIHFEGVDVSNIKSAGRAWYRANRMGFVFQSFNLLPRLNVLDNVLLPISYARSKLKIGKREALEALNRVGMDHRAKHRPNQLSGGERQRVAIARALINKPSVILADEPSGNLDSQNVERLMALFNNLVSEGQTLVMVTHDLNVAHQAQRIVHMLDGKIRKEERK